MFREFEKQRDNSHEIMMYISVLAEMVQSLIEKTSNVELDTESVIKKENDITDYITTAHKENDCLAIIESDILRNHIKVIHK